MFTTQTGNKVRHEAGHIGLLRRDDTWQLCNWHPIAALHSVTLQHSYLIA